MRRASAASADSGMLIGSRVITSAAERAMRSRCADRCRRRSPSVMTPSSAPSSAVTQVMPRPLADIVATTSGTRAPGATRGTCSPACINRSTRSRRLPSCPPGCRLAKSLSPNPLRTISVIARASPRASAAVVLAVGARFSGHASSSTRQSRVTSAARPSALAGAPVTAMSRAPIRLSVSRRRRISGVSPLRESSSTRSSSRMTPRSPCTASTGCRK